jgi:hypothetical protein
VGRQQVSSLRPLGRAYLRRLQLGSNWPVPPFQHLPRSSSVPSGTPSRGSTFVLTPASPSLSYLTQIVGPPPPPATPATPALLSDMARTHVDNRWIVPYNRCAVHIGILSHVISSPVSISYDAHTSSKRSRSVYESSGTSANASDCNLKRPRPCLRTVIA